MKKALKIIGIVVVCIFALTILIGILGVLGADDKTDKHVNETTNVAVRDDSEEIEKNRKAAFEADVKIINTLKKDFFINKDEFSNSVWINHKAFGTKYWPNRCTLAVYINETGSYYMQSNYYGDDWVFHTSVQVKIGDQVLTSEDIPTYDKRNKQDNEGGDVWEVVQYSENIPDIALAISYYDGKEPIKVRYNGRQNYHDVVLSKNDRKAITESIKFAEALKNTYGKIGAPKL